MKKRNRNIIALLAGLVIIGQMFAINWQDLGASQNTLPWLGTVVMVLVIISMLLSNRNEG